MKHESEINLEGRLRSLSGLVGEDPEFVQRVLDRIAAEAAPPRALRPTQLQRWIMRSVIGLAASLLLGAAVWSTLLFVTPQVARAVNDIPQRLSSLNALHLKGVVHAPDGPHPYELFVQRPDHCRVKGQICAGSKQYGSVKRCRITDIIITAEHRITLDTSARTATIEPNTAEDATAQVTEILQNHLQLMFGASPSFTKLRSEALGSMQADVYESRVGPLQIKLWFDPHSELPVKTAVSRTAPGKPEELLAEFDTIEANPVLDAAVFDAKVPEGFAVIRPTPATASNPEATYGGCSFGHLHISQRYNIALQQGDVLSCWCLYDDRRPGEDLKLPDGNCKLAITSTTGIAYTEHLLHADATPKGYHWRWSLLHPTKPTEKSPLAITWQAKDGNGSSGQNTVMPVVYRPEELAQRIESLQRQTLPAGGVPMTLELIKHSLEK
jgi:hypothetical protein